MRAHMFVCAFKCVCMSFFRRERSHFLSKYPGGFRSSAPGRFRYRRWEFGRRSAIPPPPRPDKSKPIGRRRSREQSQRVAVFWPTGPPFARERRGRSCANGACEALPHLRQGARIVEVAQRCASAAAPLKPLPSPDPRRRYGAKITQPEGRLQGRLRPSPPGEAKARSDAGWWRGQGRNIGSIGVGERFRVGCRRAGGFLVHSCEEGPPGEVFLLLVWEVAGGALCSQCNSCGFSMVVLRSSPMVSIKLREAKSRLPGVALRPPEPLEPWKATEAARAPGKTGSPRNQV